MNADECTENQEKGKYNRREGWEEKGLFFLKESTFHEEIWPDQGVGVLVCAADGNGSIDCTKLHVGFSVAVKFSLSVFTLLGYLWCVFVVSFLAV